MKSILESSLKTFTFSEADKSIYANLYQEFKSKDLSDDDSRLFANLTFLLTNKTMMDHLLKLLDTNVQQLWEAEKEKPDTVLELHQPAKYLPFFGLRWPSPTKQLASNHSHHLLSRVLLHIEQRHGINAGDLETAPVPTFLGVITPEDARDILVNKNKVWNDDPRMSGIFFHGKMMHRIQFCLLMLAMECGLLDTGTLSMPDIIAKLINTKVEAYSPFYDIAWNFLIDFNISDVHFTEADRRNLSPLAEFFPAHITDNTYNKPYLFGVDPYFLHSYLMTASRANTPYLSECVTQIYCKSAIAIQEFEKEKGIKVEFDGYIDNKDDKTPKTKRSKLTRKDATMQNVLARQSQTFATYGVHAVQFEDIMAKQKITDKSRRIDNKRSTPSATTGFIQFRSLFHADQAANALPDSNDRSMKRRK